MYLKSIQQKITILKIKDLICFHRHCDSSFMNPKARSSTNISKSLFLKNLTVTMFKQNIDHIKFEF